MEREQPERPEPDPAGAHLPAPRPAPEDATARTAEAANPANQTSAIETSAARREPATRLGARERAVLDFEVRRWKHAGAKEEAIRATFDLSPTSYYQVLNALLDDPAALALQPALVARLRRIRDARREARG